MQLRNACIYCPFANSMSARGQVSLELTFRQQFVFKFTIFWEPSQRRLRNSTHDELPEPWQKVPVAILKHRELSMKQHNRYTVVAVVAFSLLAAPAIYAAPTAISSPVHAMFSKTKLVKLSLRNDSGTAMDVKVGDKVVTLAPGKPVDLSLPWAHESLPLLLRQITKQGLSSKK